MSSWWSSSISVFTYYGSASPLKGSGEDKVYYGKFNMSSVAWFRLNHD